MSPTGLDFSNVEESEKIEALRFVTTSPAWRLWFAPELESAVAVSYALLKLEPARRRNQESDALLRARIEVLERLLQLGPLEIEQYDAEQVKKQERQARDEDYTARAAEGRIGP